MLSRLRTDEIPGCGVCYGIFKAELLFSTSCHVQWSAHRQVYGSLDSNSSLSRPIVPLNVQNAILARVVDLLQGVAEYNVARRKQVRKDKKRQRRDIEALIRDMKKRPSGKRKKVGSMEAIDAMFAAAYQKTTPIDNEEADVGMELDKPEPSSTHTDGLTGNRNSFQAVPEAVRCITLGINEVTKRLEHQCRPPSIRVTSGPCRDTDPEGPSPHVRIVLACRQDVDPPLLIAHIPQLVASCNARHPNEPVTLVPLPKGSEATLAQALRMRSVSVAAIEVGVLSRPEGGSPCGISLLTPISRIGLPL
jgi:ribonuclease P/MRP protein subunit POP3